MSYRFLIAACAALLFAVSAGETPAKQPNFVFFLVDDLGKPDLSCEGSTFYETPNIDALASRSMRFDNGYAACQVCSPSRAAIQTGKSPARVRITDYISPRLGNQPEKWKRNTKLLPASFDIQLAADETTIAEALKGLGYATYFAGKWHLGGEGFTPTDQGYDINVGGFEYGTPPGGYFSPYRNKRLPDGPKGEHLPIRLAKETAKFVEAQASNEAPFFAMLSFYSVHGPIQSTEALWNKYRLKAESLGLPLERQRFLFDRTQEVRQVQDHPLYAGMMETLDDAVGIVLNALEESGQADNTVVIFTSDNGGVSSGDGYSTACLPLRGGKGRQWEGGVREPFYISVPGKTSGNRTEQLAIGMDFFPTIVELANKDAAQPIEQADNLDGISLVPILNGGAVKPRSLFWHYPHYGNQGGEPSAMIRNGDWKLIHYFEDQRFELYDLASDIGETNNVIEKHPSLAEKLKSELASKLEAVEARFPTTNPNYDQAAYDKYLDNARNQRMNRREREHRAFLTPTYKPGKGWWQETGH